MKWQQVHDAFAMTCRLYQQEWQCPAAPHNVAASTIAEEECDLWCHKLAAHFADPFSPPEHLRPWILARLASAAADAALHQKLQDVPCPNSLTKEFVEHYLIAEWDHALRERWYLIAD